MSSGRFLALVSTFRERLLDDVQGVTEALDPLHFAALAFLAEHEVVDREAQDPAESAELLRRRDVPASLPGRHGLLPDPDLVGELRLRQTLALARLRDASPDRSVHNYGLYGTRLDSTTSRQHWRPVTTLGARVTTVNGKAGQECTAW